MDDLKYPIGKFVMPTEVSETSYDAAVDSIAELPANLLMVLKDTDEIFLDTPYRPEGWTVRQVIHHLADSHCQSFSRVKMALSENCPVIKPYDENAWALMTDSVLFPISSSCKMLEGIHERWTYLLRNLTPKEKNQVFFHPEKKREISITETAFLYAWHGKHHLAHISNLKKRIFQSLS